MWKLSYMAKFLIVAAFLFALAAPASAPSFAGGLYNPKTGNYEMPLPTITIEKTIPADLQGEWCYASTDPNEETTNYELPSWSEPGACDKKDKILSVSDRSVSVNEIYCEPSSKINVKVDCAPSGCSTEATFAAQCYQGMSPNVKWKTAFKLSRYKGNIWVKSVKIH
jgi:hypothetical protein